MANTNLSWAMACYREMERADLLAEKKRHQLALAVALLPDSDKDEYVAKTEQIRAEFEGKRETARRKGQVG